MTKPIYFRVSIHDPYANIPFAESAKWAAGLPSMLKTVQDIKRSSKYGVRTVPEVVAALKKSQPDNIVITVY